MIQRLLYGILGGSLGIQYAYAYKELPVVAGEYGKPRIPEYSSLEDIERDVTFKNYTYAFVGFFSDACADSINAVNIFNAQRHGMIENVLTGKLNVKNDQNAAEKAEVEITDEPEHCFATSLRLPNGLWVPCPHGNDYFRTSSWLQDQFRVTFKFRNDFDFPIYPIYHREDSEYTNSGGGTLNPGEIMGGGSIVSHVFSFRKVADPSLSSADLEHLATTNAAQIGPLVHWLVVRGPGTVAIGPDNILPIVQQSMDCAERESESGSGDGGAGFCPNLEVEMMDDAYSLWFDKRQGLNVVQTALVPPVTEGGFMKARMPDHVYKAIYDFYRRGKEYDEQMRTAAGEGAGVASEGGGFTPLPKPPALPLLETLAGPCLNQIFSPTYMTTLDKAPELKQLIFDEMRPIMEAWSGQQNLIPTSLYGVRTYTNGSILRMHVDTANTHVVSAIFNIDQDVDEDWKLEIYDHDGNLHKIPMAPGDMVFYESARLLHGRPQPLNGKYYANAFLHYKTEDWRVMM